MLKIIHHIIQFSFDTLEASFDHIIGDNIFSIISLLEDRPAKIIERYLRLIIQSLPLINATISQTRGDRR